MKDSNDNTFSIHLAYAIGRGYLCFCVCATAGASVPILEGGRVHYRQNILVPEARARTHDGQRL